MRNECADILAANRLGYALCSELFTGPARPANTARFVFLDPRATGFFVDWDRVASEVVATLRSQAGRDPYDRGLSDLVGELSTRSEEFGTRWAARNVRRHRTGRKQLPWAVAGVQRRARVSLPGRPGPAGLLGGHARPARPGGDGPGARPGVTGGP